MCTAIRIDALAVGYLRRDIAPNKSRASRVTGSLPNFHREKDIYPLYRLVEAQLQGGSHPV